MSKQLTDHDIEMLKTKRGEQMSGPLETKQLGTRPFQFRGRELQANVSVQIYHDDVPFDGDHPEDIAAFERGDFQMYVLIVKAYFAGHVSGSDALGGNAAEDYTDLEKAVDEHDMIENALTDLARILGDIVDAVK